MQAIPQTLETGATRRDVTRSAPVVTRQGTEYRVTGATYLGDRASCANGPLWEVHAVRMHDGAGAYWHASDAPVVAIVHCDATTAPCAVVGCYGHDVRAEGDPMTAPAVDTRACSCARHADGSVTAFLCPVHADTDPCLTLSRVTGRRRTGTIRRGVCTSCGHYSWPVTR